MPPPLIYQQPLIIFFKSIDSDLVVRRTDGHSCSVRIVGNGEDNVSSFVIKVSESMLRRLRHF